MVKDKLIEDILSNEQIQAYFNYLKTCNWRELKENRKRNFFTKFNRLVTNVIGGIGPLKVIIGDGEISQDNFIGYKEYQNIFIDNEKRMVINDINYNQYLTLYEYFFRLRLHVLCLSNIGEFDAKLSDEVKNSVEKNLRYIEYGDINIKLDKDDGEFGEDFQFINIEARKFAQNIMFEVVRNNFDYNDGYDEELFMSNHNVLDNKFVMEVGQTHNDDHVVETFYVMHKLEIIKRKVEQLKNSKISMVDDKDLFFMVYPSVIKNSETPVVIKAFNEIIDRIYGSDLKIVSYKKGFKINNNVYSADDLNNLLNIVLYECLNDMDVYLREDTSFLNSKEIEEKGLEFAITSYKKKWLESVILKIDKSVDPQELIAFKHQTIYRLLNRANLMEAINKTNGSYYPFKKGGKK